MILLGFPINVAGVEVAYSRYLTWPPLLGTNPLAVGNRVSGLVPISSAPFNIALAAVASLSYVSFLSRPTTTASTPSSFSFWLNELKVFFNPLSPITYKFLYPLPSR